MFSHMEITEELGNLRCKINLKLAQFVSITEEVYCGSF